MVRIVATWAMAKDGVVKGTECLTQNGSALDAVEIAAKEVENAPHWSSVGYGGLPNEDMQVELDAGFMNGDTLAFGAVCGIREVANPVSVARELSKNTVNCVLVGHGASVYAQQQGFEMKDMLTEKSKAMYEKQRKEMQNFEAYRGHDTVGVLALDENGTMAAATSTSGLFMKKSGRVGDSPLIGSGLYADSEVGAATATGLGEDLMKGCISYEIVTLMKHGKSPQEACEIAVFELEEKLKRRHGTCSDLSVVALNNQGEWGAATNIENYSVSVMEDDGHVQVYRILCQQNHCERIKATDQWYNDYVEEHVKPVEE